MVIERETLEHVKESRHDSSGFTSLLYYQKGGTGTIELLASPQRRDTYFCHKEWHTLEGGHSMTFLTRMESSTLGSFNSLAVLGRCQ